jgi:hypothetical protein
VPKQPPRHRRGPRQRAGAGQQRPPGRRPPAEPAQGGERASERNSGQPAGRRGEGGREADRGDPETVAGAGCQGVRQTDTFPATAELAGFLATSVKDLD